MVSVGVTASVGCGGQSVAATTSRLPAAVLPGWRAVDTPPGIAQLAPSLHELHVVAQVDRDALVKKGDAIRSTTFTFATPKEAAEAQKRGAGDDYQGDIERALHGDMVARGPGVGLRLRVPRPTGSGSDSVEVYLLARGRRLTVVELLSALGFDRSLRDRILARLSR